MTTQPGMVHAWALAHLGPLARSAPAAPDLVSWLPTAPLTRCAAVGLQLGELLGELHRTTRGLAEREPTLTSSAAPGAWEAVAGWLAHPPWPDLDPIRLRAAAATASVLAGGRGGPTSSLVLGHPDLRAIRVCDDGVVIEAWESAHFGYPAEDVGSLVAHLWLANHLGTDGGEGRARALADGLLTGWLPRVVEGMSDGERQSTARRCAACFGLELLHFASLTDGGSADRTVWVVREVIQAGVAHLSGELGPGIFLGIVLWQGEADGRELDEQR